VIVSGESDPRFGINFNVALHVLFLWSSSLTLAGDEIPELHRIYHRWGCPGLGAEFLYLFGIRWSSDSYTVRAPNLEFEQCENAIK
jgi:hypothetical protein